MGKRRLVSDNLKRASVFRQSENGIPVSHFGKATETHQSAVEELDVPRVKTVYGRFKATAKSRASQLAAGKLFRGWPSPTGKSDRALSGPPLAQQAAKGKRLRDTTLSLKRKDEED